MEQLRLTSLDEPDGASEAASGDAPNERIVYTIPEVAALLGVNRTTVYRWAQRGDIPVVRMGTSRMFVSKRMFLERFGISADLVALSS